MSRKKSPNFLDSVNKTWLEHSKNPSKKAIESLELVRKVAIILDSIDTDRIDEASEQSKFMEARIQAFVASLNLPDEESPEVTWMKRILNSVMDGSELTE